MVRSVVLVSEIRILGLQTVPLIQHRDDLARLIVDAVRRENVTVEEGDIFVVGQKIVSKANGLIASLDSVRASRRAARLAKKTGKDARFVELVLRGSSRVVKAAKKILLAETRSGAICLNAGVDKSNVQGRLNYSVLPDDPASAANMLRRKLEHEFSCRLAVIVADTFSRPFRRGQTEYALGGAGIEPVLDYRGSQDLFGYRLQFKFVAIADELAAAAELVIGQGTERVPVAIVKGFTRMELKNVAWDSRALKIKRREDLFRGTL